jgi:ubiquinone/menaquinone biosynthesis C-methylase UbiE
LTKIEIGFYTFNFYHDRQKKRPLIYRLKRRTLEVEDIIRCFSEKSDNTILDIGTADGLMLDILNKRFLASKFIGLEYNYSLLSATRLKSIHKIQGNGLFLPIKSDSIDIIIATAIIEHITDTQLFLKETERALRIGGLIVITTPHPTMDWLAEKIGLLKESGHQNTYTLKELRQEIEKYCFQVIKTKRFMFSPIGFPAERTIEKFFGPLGLKLIMANQILAARRINIDK